jgi:serralysin
VVNTLDVLLKGLIDSPQTDQTIKGISFLPGTHSGGAGNDHITGGWFSDTLFGKDGNDVLDGGAGKDKLYGGGNNDTYIVDNVGDQVIENRGEGIDSVKASVSYSLSNNVENLYLTGKDAINGTGNDLNNLLIGNDSNNILRGNGGNDQLLGGGGNDTLIGGAGADTLVGGLGRDLFVYNTISDSTVEAVDHILDFVSGEDRIDFSGLSKFISGGGHFTFVDELVGKAGQIVFNTDSNSTKLSVDFGGDGLADFAISLIGQATAADVIVA